MNPPRIEITGNVSAENIGLGLSVYRQAAVIPDRPPRVLAVNGVIIVAEPGAARLLIIEVPNDGFLTHPRVGDRVSQAFYRQESTSEGVDTIAENHPMVSGNGFAADGTALPDRPFAFPIVDDDHGTKQFARLPDAGWEFDKDPDGENYGNIDWKGLNTAPEGQPSDASILTYKGPSSRHTLQKPGAPTLHIPGFTSLLDVVGADPISYHTVFGTKVYESGEEIAEGPTSYPNEGLDKALCLGAAYFNDELVVMWCINQRNNPEHTPGYYHTLMKAVGGEWELLWESNLGMPYEPWFPSPDGSKMISVFGGQIHRISISDAWEVTYAAEAVGEATREVTKTDSRGQVIEYTPCLSGDVVVAGHPVSWGPYGDIYDSVRDCYDGKGLIDSGAVTYRVDYGGEVAVAADYRPDGTEFVLKKKVSGYEESAVDGSHHYQVYGKGYFIPDYEAAALDPDTISPSIAADYDPVTQIVTVSSYAVCRPVYTASCGTQLTATTFDVSACMDICVAGDTDITFTATGDGPYSAETTITISSPGPSAMTVVVSGTGNSRDVAVTGGVPPYSYTVSKGTINSSGTWDVSGKCGMGTVTVTDHCGATKTATNRMPLGSWTWVLTCDNPNAYWGINCIGSVNIVDWSAHCTASVGGSTIRTHYETYPNAGYAGACGGGACADTTGQYPVHAILTNCGWGYVGVSFVETLTWGC